MICKLLSILFVAGSFSSVYGQTCPQTCVKACNPNGEVKNKRLVQRCEASCISKCYKCQVATDVVYPKYYVLGLVYSPPGCTSTSAQPCTTASTVDYLEGSTMGTKASMQSSFEKGIDVKVDTSLGNGGLATSFSTSVTAGYSITSSDSSSSTVSKSTSLEAKATGNADGVDHDQDSFILLLNPAVAVQQQQEFNTDQKCGAVGNLNWDLGLNPSLGNGSALRYTVTAGELKNPQTMPADVAQQFAALNITSPDFQTILALDTFGNGSTAIDLSRFTPTLTNFPYEPPPQAPACNKGVCTCLPFTQVIRNDFATDMGSSTTTQYKVGFTESVKGSFISWASLGGTSDQTLTWTSSASTDDTTDASQSATASVQCPSINYQGPTEMLVYWDNLFGSFMFYPTTIASPQVAILAQGTVTSNSQQPIQHQLVTLQLSGKTHYTSTDNSGKYTFLTSPGLAPGGSAQLTVMGQSQTVALSPSQQFNISVP